MWVISVWFCSHLIPLHAIGQRTHVTSPMCCRGALCTFSGRSDGCFSPLFFYFSLYFVYVRILGMMVGDEEWVSCLGRRTSPPVGRHPLGESWYCVMLRRASVGHGCAWSEHVRMLRQLLVSTVEPSQRVEPVWVLRVACFCTCVKLKWVYFNTSQIALKFK
jgi:hypothetical protein